MNARADDVRAAYPLFQGEGGGANPTSALQLTIHPINIREAMRLNKMWHSVLPDCDIGTMSSKPSVSFGAEYGGKWYAVAIWSRPVAIAVAKDPGALELRRLAISPDAPKNTASRMLRVMAQLVAKRFPSINRLVSYQAVAVHDGTIYKAAGWVPTKFTKYSAWGTRRRRKRAAGFIVAPSTRRPPQVISDKVRWEKLVNITCARKVDCKSESAPGNQNPTNSPQTPPNAPETASPSLTEPEQRQGRSKRSILLKGGAALDNGSNSNRLDESSPTAATPVDCENESAREVEP